YGQDIRPEGSSIPIDPSLEFNGLRIEIVQGAVTGSYEGQVAASLAEVEVIGRAVTGQLASFIRGDANCDGVVELSDVFSIVAHTFMDPRPRCCDAASDANADGVIDMTDPILLLGFLFLGGPSPAQPFPNCEAVAVDPGSCDQAPGRCF